MSGEREFDEEFDRIIDGLELDTSGLERMDDAPAPAPEPSAPRRADVPRAETDHGSPDDDDAWDDEPDDAFYREVDSTPPRPRDPVRLAGWLGAVGAPLALVAASLLNLRLPAAAMIVLALIFVAGAIALISRLPAHGPSRPDWPDDGAVL